MSLHTRQVRESMGLRLINEIRAIDPEKARKEREARLESHRAEIRRAIEEYREAQREPLPTHEEITLEVSRNDPRYLAVAKTLESMLLQDAYIMYPTDRMNAGSCWLDLISNLDNPDQ